MPEILNPATGDVVTHIDYATAADVDTAVGRAKAAFPEWSRATPGERSARVAALAAAMDARAEEYVQTETAQTGKPLRLSREFDVPGSIDNALFFSGAARNLEGKASAEWDGTHTSLIRREPIGVVGSIAPWNYPLQMAMWKILPAISAGNSIVLKPAEITPLTALMVAEDARAAGIPDGVVTVIVGTSAEGCSLMVRSAGRAAMSRPSVPWM